MPCLHGCNVTVKRSPSAVVAACSRRALWLLHPKLMQGAFDISRATKRGTNDATVTSI